LLRDLTAQKEVQDLLVRIEDRLMVCAAHLASDQVNSAQKLPEISEEDVLLLEKTIDAMQEKMPILDGFVLPGGHPLSSQYHIARTVCRRAERKMIALLQESHIPEILLRYINRLSDFLFILARKALLDSGNEEIRWNPDL